MQNEFPRIEKGRIHAALIHCVQDKLNKAEKDLISSAEQVKSLTEHNAEMFRQHKQAVTENYKKLMLTLMNCDPVKNAIVTIVRETITGSVDFAYTLSVDMAFASYDIDCVIDGHSIFLTNKHNPPFSLLELGKEYTDHGVHDRVSARYIALDRY